MIRKPNCLIIGVDNGNSQTKTSNFCFTSGLKNCGGVKPPLQNELIEYKGAYWCLTKERKPYSRDKTGDQETFILTLFAIAKELHAEHLEQRKEYTIRLAVGLPPAHFGKQQSQFAQYFRRYGSHCQFKYIQGNRKVYEYWIDIKDVDVYVQGYAASLVTESTIKDYDQYYVVDIGGYTTDVILVDEGRPDIAQCLSLEKGMIGLTSGAAAEVSASLGQTISERQVEMRLRGKNILMAPEVSAKIDMYAQQYATKLVDQMCEHGIQVDHVPVLFIGGGSLVLRNYFKSTKITACDFVDQVGGNAIGYETMSSFRFRRDSADARIGANMRTSKKTLLTIAQAAAFMKTDYRKIKGYIEKGVLVPQFWSWKEEPLLLLEEVEAFRTQLANAKQYPTERIELRFHTVWPREADALELLKKISEGKTAYVSKALLFYEAYKDTLNFFCEAYKDPINEPAVPSDPEALDALQKQAPKDKRPDIPAPASKQKREEKQPSQDNEVVEMSEKDLAGLMQYLNNQG